MTPTPPDDPHVRIERAFPFPREAVFDAWTTPALLARWFAPKGCSFELLRAELRAGGGFHACVRNGSFVCWTVADFVEVTRPERIVFLWRLADESGAPASARSQGHHHDWPDETQVTVTFAARPGGTLVTLEQTVSEALAKQTGAYPSWLEQLDHLEELLGGGRVAGPSA